MHIHMNRVKNFSYQNIKECNLVAYFAMHKFELKIPKRRLQKNDLKNKDKATMQYWYTDI